MIILTSEEESILRLEYERYCRDADDGFPPMEFDEWWREMADNAKDRAKYE